MIQVGKRGPPPQNPDLIRTRISKNGLFFGPQTVFPNLGTNEVGN